MSASTVIVDNQVHDKRVAAVALRDERLQRSRFQARAYLGNARLPDPDLSSHVMTRSNLLRAWVVNSSWTECQTCGNLLPCELTPGSLAGRTSTRPKCPCSNATYRVPKLSDWPEILRGFTLTDQNVLAFYRLYYGSTAPRQHGYREKNGPVRACLISESVQTRLQAIEDSERRARLYAAYCHLMQCPESAYRDMDAAHRNGTLPVRLPLSRMCQVKWIETALWPLIYPYKWLCESAVVDGGVRMSAKRLYAIKLTCSVFDYCGFFPLLRYQYDRWLYKTVSGALTTAARLHCSPARALDNKTFSSTYWEYQLSYVLDAVKMYGFPDIFITISPYEWEFPAYQKLVDRFDQLGRGPTGIAAIECLHQAHVLQEILRKYVSGKGRLTWKNHLLCNRNTGSNNVRTYFYRFEFQKRGTLHVHYIAWLEDTSAIDISHLSADFPQEDNAFAELVYTTQRSSKAVPGMSVHEGDSQVVTDDGTCTLLLRRSQSAHSLNLRVYSEILLRVLRCSMDIQLTDGGTMLMKYVAGYVSKFRETSVPRDVLFSDLEPNTIAYRYANQLCPDEPEMVLTLSDVKMAYTSSDTKRYLVPTLHRVRDDNAVKAYMQRPIYDDNLTLHEYLHRYTVTRACGHQRRSKKDLLVGFKYVDMFNDQYFFQDALLNTPFRNLDHLQFKDFEHLPQDIRIFSFAIHNRTAFWQDTEALSRLCDERGCRRHYKVTFLSYVSSLLEVWRHYFNRQISHDALDTPGDKDTPCASLSPHQAAFVNTVVEKLRCASDIPPYNEDDGDDNRRYFLLTGEHGTGKSYCLREIIRQAIRMASKTLIITPTGLLATTYKDVFGDDVTADTVHAAFRLASGIEGRRAAINWDIRLFDLIVMDEISMISVVHADHIKSTLASLGHHCLIVLCGDRHQLQPIPVHGVVGSLFDDRDLLHACYVTRLRRQFRTQDDELSDFLKICRVRYPRNFEINAFVSGLVLLDDFPSDEDLIRVHDNHPERVVLCFTRSSANRFNSLICANDFKDSFPLKMCRYPSPDGDLEPVFEGMPIMLTENRDKKRSFVNGQTGNIHSVIDNTILVQILDDRIIRVYPVTTPDGIYYPFTLRYAGTIHKAQGQTLSSVIVWFDSRKLPPGCAYVALSRVKCRNDIRFMTTPIVQHFRPATEDDSNI